MATVTIPKILANFETSLNGKISPSATDLILNTSVDNDGTTLSGTYSLTIDEGTTSEEHMIVTLAGSAGTITRRGLSRVDAWTEVTGNKIEHNRGASVKVTNISNVNLQRLLSGVDSFDATQIMSYGSAPALSAGSNQLATVAYADAISVAGAANATTTTKGIVELATQEDIDAKTATGGTGASLAVTPDKMNSVRTHDYAVSATGNDSYAITLTPAPTAYTTGDVYVFKADVANTGACTLNVNALGAKSIKVSGSLDPQDGYIAAGQIVTVIYDGTNMQVQSVGKPSVSQNGSEVYATSTTGNDTYVVTLSPVPSAYTNGMIVRFKPDTANTGAATLNVNGLGAKTIKKNSTTDLLDNDIIANQIVEVVYDGTNFVLTSPTANSTMLSPVSKVINNVVVAGTTVNNATTTVLSSTILANTFTANSTMRIQIHCTHSGNAGSPSRVMTVSFGGTTIATISQGSTGTTETFLSEIWVHFGNTSGTADIRAHVYNSLTAASSTITSTSTITNNTSTASLTSDQTFQLSITSGANGSMTYYSCSVEKI